MNLWRRFVFRIRALFVKRKLDAEMNEEMRVHVAMRTQQNIEAGMSPEEARYAALRQFGHADGIKEICREQREGFISRQLSEVSRNLLFALRQLRKNPGFTAVAVLTLALGIGANTAMFSAVNALWLRALPFPGSDRLVLVWGKKPQQGRDKIPFSWPNFADLRAQGQSFESMGAWALGRANLTGDDKPEQVQQAIVNSGFFATMGINPILGRTFLPSEDERGGEKVVVLSYSLWQRRFGADANVVGRSITLDGQGYQVVGVMPVAFRFLSFPKDTEIWMPFGLDPFTDRRFARAVNSLGVIGRLKTGTSLAQARAEVDAIARPLAEQYPDNKEWGITLVALKEQVVANYRLALLVLVVAVGFVLMIGCANVANLLLARANARQREIAIRSALGASRARVIRQLFTENLLLSVLGGALGLLLAYWAAELLRAFPLGAADFSTPYNVPRESVGLDSRLMWFTAGLSCLTALLFGLVPSLRASRTDLSEALKVAAPTDSSGGRGFGLHSILVTAEVALSLVLLIGAGLLIRSFSRLQETKPGFQPDNLLTANISLPRTKYPQGDQITGFYQQVLDRVAALPGVKAVGAVEYLPLSGIDSSTVLLIEGAPEPGAGEERRTHNRNTTPGYFKAMGIPLVQGRDFTERDSKDAPKVTVINETMARRYWPNENPLGKRVALMFEALRFRPDGPPEVDIKLGLREIVGVVADVKHSKLDAAPVPEMFLPLAQRPASDMTLVVRTQGEPASLIPALQGEVRALDKDQPISGITTMSQLRADSVAQPRYNSHLLSAFAVVAMLLSAVGIYGVIAYSVSQRTREIGIRMALGAQRRDVLGMVLRQGMTLAGVGVVFGLAGAFALTHLLRKLLFGISPTDGVTFVVVPMLLGAVAFVACWIPARRAMRVDPMVALRME